MPKISIPTKSFIFLFIAAFVGTFLTVLLSYDVGFVPFMELDGLKSAQEQKKDALEETTVIPEVPVIDTSEWLTYTNNEFDFSFNYKPGWKVLPIVVKSGFNVLQIDPGTKYYNIKVYISKTGFYAVEGLPAKTDNIGGQTGLNISNLLFAVKHNDNYFTFDNGISTSLKPDFTALVRSVVFE